MAAAALVLLVGSVGAVASVPVPGAGPRAARPTVVLREADEQGVVVELAGVPPRSVASLEPGLPDLGATSVLVGVPPTARVRLAVLRTAFGVLDRPPATAPRVRPAAALLLAAFSGPAAVSSRAAFYDQAAQTLLRASAAAEGTGNLGEPAAGWSPPCAARITDDAWLRDQRVVRIELFAYQYHPRLHQLRRNDGLRVAVRFDAAAVSVADVATARPDPFEPVYRRHIANYEVARAWRARAPAVSDVASPASGRLLAGAGRLKVPIDRDGLYVLTYGDLRDAGWDVTAIDPRRVTMTSQGEAVAIEVAGEDDGSFDPTDRILFYGQRLRGPVMTTKYTDVNVYWLEVGEALGQRMARRDASPGGVAPARTTHRHVVHAEESMRWWTFHFTGEDVWFWERFQPGPGATASATYTVTLPGVARAAASAVVRGELVAFNGRAGHHTRVMVNDRPTPVTDDIWDGARRFRLEGVVPAAALRDGANLVTVSVINDRPEAVDDMFLDWIEIEYDRRFEAEGDELVFIGPESGRWRYDVDRLQNPTVHVLDITTPLSPVRLTGAEVTARGSEHRASFTATHAAEDHFLVATELALDRPALFLAPATDSVRDGNGGADLIIVAAPVFVEAVERLAAYRRSQGRRVRVVDVDDVFDAYNHGIYHPHAIRAFLADAYARWPPPAPAYVLLVGDGHFNFKHFNPAVFGNDPILLPPNLEWVDLEQGEVDSANRLVTVAGDDVLPDMAIGRLPANTVAELDTMIDKILTYEAAPPGEWQRHDLFIADNVSAAAGDFVERTNRVIAHHVAPGITVHRVFLNDFAGRCGEPDGVHGCPAANAAILDHLNGVGARYVSYHGHGADRSWAHELMFVGADVSRLSNRDRLPVTLSMTCLDGYWYDPRWASLAELLVRAANGGAAASFSSTGLALSEGQLHLWSGFYDAVDRDGLRDLGTATIAAKLNLFRTGGWRELIDTYGILGDPMLRLPAPPPPPSPTPSPPPTATPGATRPPSPTPPPAHTVYLPHLSCARR